ncbi:MAG: RluA family pseudouridine synthase [Candidatus Omnitrophica bacterium]|nr:RluA family pseudouridine synthase [Candidatus Omnitrophota bacterium]
MLKTFSVRENTQLLTFLIKTLADYKRNKIKNLLKFKSVFVNGASVTQFNHALVSGDQVSIETDKKAKGKPLREFGIQIVHEDEAVIVIEKPAGLLTVSTEKVREKTAFYQTFEYVRQSASYKSARIFIVHRLDKEASGLIVFAKNMSAKTWLQLSWKKFEKRYFAVVRGTLKEKSGTISSHLEENKFLSVHSGKPTEKSKLAVTKYMVLKSNGKYSLLEVTLETGRKHQIRVHLADLGHPIVGDERYGSKDKFYGEERTKRIALHACYLAFDHPVTKKRVEFKSGLPDSLKKLI